MKKETTEKTMKKIHKMLANVAFLSALIRYDTLCTSVCLVHLCLCEQNGAIQHPNVFPAGAKNTVTRSGAQLDEDIAKRNEICVQIRSLPN